MSPSHFPWRNPARCAAQSRVDAAPVHPDGLLGGLPRNVRAKGDHLLGSRIGILPYTQQGGTAPRIIGRMRTALILGKLEESGRPGVGPQARGVVDRNPKIVADFRAGDALRFVFVKAVIPFAAGIDLRFQGQAKHCQRRQGQKQWSNGSDELDMDMRYAPDSGQAG